jgi:hypothetical protein
VADVAHEPDDAEYCQHNQTGRDQPHKDNPDPAEWSGSVRVSPILLKTRES